MNDGRPLRAAIVGAGLMGKWHADAVKKIGGVVAIVADTDPSRAYNLAHELGAASTGSVGGALSADLVDVVHVCAPPSDHRAIVRSALVAGLHVICEKPLAETAAGTAELYAMASERERLLCPVHQYLFQDGVIRVMRDLSSLGQLTSVSSVISSAGADGGDDAARDRLSIDTLAHPLSLAARIVPGGLAGVEWSVTRASPGELQAIGTQSVLSLSIQVSTRGRPTVSSLRVTGDRQTAEVDLFHGFVSFDEVELSRQGKIVHPFTSSARALAAATMNLARRAARRESAFPGLRELVRRFYAAVRSNEPAPIGRDESLDVAAARDAIAAVFRAEGAAV
jgi:predicted dehydrogenase